MEKVNDERLLEDVTNILTNGLARIIQHKLWSTQWIDKMHINLIDALKSDAEYLNNPIIMNIVEKYLNQLNVELKHFWYNFSQELFNLINDTLNGRTDIIINKTQKTFAVRIYEEHVKLNINKMLKTNGISVHVILTDINGFFISVPKIIDEEEAFPMRLGFAATDEVIYHRPRMNTAHIWQAILWSFLYPSKIYVTIDSLNVNKSDITVNWRLIALDHPSLKRQALNLAKELSIDDLFKFLLTAILCDGGVYNYELSTGYTSHTISLTMNYDKFPEWEPILNKLKSAGINWSKSDSSSTALRILFSASHAKLLASNIINSLSNKSKSLLDSLIPLGLQKWINLKQLLNIEFHYKWGQSQIIFNNIGFTISVDDDGGVYLFLASR